MIKRVIFLSFIIFSVSFGKVNDTNNYLKEDEIQEVEKRVMEIEEKYDITYYINLGRKMDERNITEKTAVLDIIPDGEDEINVKLKFTLDINADSYEEEIDNLLMTGEDAIVKKEYKTFILGIIDITDEILQAIEEEAKRIELEEAEKKSSANKFGVVIILFFIVIAILATLKFAKLGGILKNNK